MRRMGIPRGVTAVMVLAVLAVVAVVGMVTWQHVTGPPVVDTAVPAVLAEEAVGDIEAASLLSPLAMLLLMLPGVFAVPMLIVYAGYRGLARGRFAPRLLLCFTGLARGLEFGVTAKRSACLWVKATMMRLIEDIERWKHSMVAGLTAALHNSLETSKTRIETSWEARLIMVTPLRC